MTRASAQSVLLSQYLWPSLFLISGFCCSFSLSVSGTHQLLIARDPPCRAVEILRKAQESQELRSQGQAGQLPFQAIKRAFQRNSGDNGSEDKFERLLRFSFYQATALDHLQNGAVIVFVLFAEALQKGMSAGYLVGHPSRTSRKRPRAVVCRILLVRKGT